MTTEKIQQVQAYSSPNWNWYAWLWGTTNSVIATSVTAKPAPAPWPTGLQSLHCKACTCTLAHRTASPPLGPKGPEEVSISIQNHDSLSLHLCYAGGHKGSRVTRATYPLDMEPLGLGLGEAEASSVDEEARDAQQLHGRPNQAGGHYVVDEEGSVVWEENAPAPGTER